MRGGGGGVRVGVIGYCNVAVRRQLCPPYHQYSEQLDLLEASHTVKILKFGTPQTIAIIVLKIETFDVILH